MEASFGCSFSHGHINCLVCKNVINWHFTGFYGSPDASCRKDSWMLLRRLMNSSPATNIP